MQQQQKQQQQQQPGMMMTARSSTVTHDSISMYLVDAISHISYVTSYNLPSYIIWQSNSDNSNKLLMFQILCNWSLISSSQISWFITYYDMQQE